jgi:hypothetical protein
MDQHLVAAESSAAAEREDLRRSLQAAQCSLCSTLLPVGLMVPDGGEACADIRWYCKDARSCTERWTAHLPGSPGFGPPSEPVGAAEEALGHSSLPAVIPLRVAVQMSGQ